MKRINREGSQESDDHEHCNNCCNSKCGTKLSTKIGCPIQTCKLECGSRFHSCKYEEHKLLCSNEKVKCINSENGCPLLLQRSQLGSHLQRCPASVVYCTMEWNRWPVYSRERQSRVPFVTDNIHARNGQLDVALALRDQRMLNEAMKAPRSVRRVLRNSLTQRFPAVPIRHGSCKPPDMDYDNSSLSVSEDEGNMLQKDRNSAGVKYSFNEELLQATRNTTESLSNAIQYALDEQSNSGANSLQSDSSDQHISAKTDKQSADQCGQHDDSMDTSEEQLIEELPRIVEVEGINPDKEESGDDTLSHPEKSDLEKLNENDTRYNLYMSVIGLDSPKPEKSDASKDKSTDEDVLTSYKLPAVEVPIPPPPPLATKDTLALDLNLESITRYQAKPRSMYTFLCAQEFRRDEYLSHFKNVHDDIHGGLNGWLEQRCPLAHYGCNYSLRRLHPKERGAQVVHNEALESFGVKPFLPEHQRDTSKVSITNGNYLISPAAGTKSSPTENATQEDNIITSLDGNCNQHSSSLLSGSNSVSDSSLDQPSNSSDSQSSFMLLPFEVLRHICKFLDGYSLCNIALTSHILREVACSLLEEKGIVIQQWARTQVNNKYHWHISYKRWIFSTAFTPVEQWGFEDQPHMANHLRKCPFYLKTTATHPHHLPNLKCELHHSNNFQAIMKRMYPNFTITYSGEEGAVCNGDSGLC